MIAIELVFVFPADGLGREVSIIPLGHGVCSGPSMDHRQVGCLCLWLFLGVRSYTVRRYSIMLHHTYKHPREVGDSRKSLVDFHGRVVMMKEKIHKKTTEIGTGRESKRERLLALHGTPHHCINAVCGVMHHTLSHSTIMHTSHYHITVLHTTPLHQMHDTAPCHTAPYCTHHTTTPLHSTPHHCIKCVTPHIVT